MDCRKIFRNTSKLCGRLGLYLSICPFKIYVFLGSTPLHLDQGLGEWDRVTTVPFLHRHRGGAGNGRLDVGCSGFGSCEEYELPTSSTLGSRAWTECPRHACRADEVPGPHSSLRVIAWSSHQLASLFQRGVYGNLFFFGILTRFCNSLISITCDS